uniref:Uncharacterized protein n=1 Tax=Rhizophora mucronata TaxID=61149 RepID=A0A2P2QGA1_RHIMU
MHACTCKYDPSALMLRRNSKYISIAGILHQSNRHEENYMW